MRISDWSSDVCSSDLAHGLGEHDLAEDQVARQAERLGGLLLAARHADDAGAEDLRHVGAVAQRVCGYAGRHRLQHARTSDVSGKSVTVRVDLGGRRSIKT